jgi:hypothetical protein
MMKNRKAMMLGLAVVLAASTAWSQSLEEKQWRASEDKQFAKYLGYFTSSGCKATVTGKIDWTTGFTLHKTSPSIRCNFAISGALQVCVTPDGAAAVQKQIKTFNCVQGSAKSFVLKDGVATDTITDSGDAPDTKTVHDYLMKTLQ